MAFFNYILIVFKNGGHTMSTKSQMRQTAILSLLTKMKFVEISQLTTSFHVSEATIRRDLVILEQNQKLKRIPGGAINIDNERPGILTPENEINVPGRMQICAEEKKKVAKYVVENYIKDGDCIYIDAESSMVYLADYLVDKLVKIVTANVLFIARTFSKPCLAKIYTIGGYLIRRYFVNTGINANQQINQYSFDKAIISCVGVDIANDMTSTAETETTAIKQIAMRNAKQNLLVFDSHKLNVKAFCKFVPLSTFDLVFCNQDPQREWPKLPDSFVLVP